MENKIRLRVEPRFVKEEVVDGQRIRPFQKETLDAIKNSDAKIILVEAPVGSGKSYIIRNLIMDEYFKGKTIVLTYPTKILMDAQVEAMKGENVAVWPDDKEIFPLEGKNSGNILKYSLDSLSQYFGEYPEEFDAFENRGEFLGGGLFKLEYGEYRIFVTTPDVIWLIYSKRYKGSHMLQAQLKEAIISFDEFHAYANLYNFYKLLENLVFKSKVEKILLLSATPYLRREKWGEIEQRLKEKRITTNEISFEESTAKEDGQIFNYPLNLSLYNFRYTDRSLCFNQISEILESIEMPAAVIFDSIFRLKHLKGSFEKLDEKNGGKFKIREWSGMKKDDDVIELVRDQGNVIVLGTSAIEVGIDMKFRSLITEASNWASAIQRIGRVGRLQYSSNNHPDMNKGNVCLFVNSRDTFNRFEMEKRLPRKRFENALQETLPNPDSDFVSGEMFRGESYDFILIDKFIPKPVIYSETIFAMYNVDEQQCKDFYGSDEDKRGILRKEGIKDKNLIEEIIWRDKLSTIWGIVVSVGLADKYDRIIGVRKEPKDNPRHIIIYTNTNLGGFYFYKERPQYNSIENEDIF